LRECPSALKPDPPRRGGSSRDRRHEGSDPITSAIRVLEVTLRVKALESLLGGFQLASSPCA